MAGPSSLKLATQRGSLIHGGAAVAPWSPPGAKAPRKRVLRRGRSRQCPHESRPTLAPPVPAHGPLNSRPHRLAAGLVTLYAERPPTGRIRGRSQVRARGARV